MMPVTPATLVKHLRLVQRILAGRRVEDKQGRMGRPGVDLLQHTDDLLELGHQVGLVLQAAGGVDDQDIDVAGPGFHIGVEGKARGIGAGRPGHDGGADAPAPDLELLDGGGPERVAGGEHDGEALAARDGAELADRGRLARTVHSDDQDDEGTVSVLESERAFDGRQDLLDLARKHGPDLLGSDFAVVAAHRR